MVASRRVGLASGGEEQTSSEGFLHGVVPAERGKLTRRSGLRGSCDGPARTGSRRLAPAQWCRPLPAGQGIEPGFDCWEEVVASRSFRGSGVDQAHATVGDKREGGQAAANQQGWHCCRLDGRL